MKIIKYPNPILNKKTKDINISEFGIDKLKSLGDEMIKTMYKNNGVGLAAPQIGKSIRMCAIRKDAVLTNTDYKTNFNSDIVLINPIIIENSVEVAELEEGCLSIPNTTKIVKRYKTIKVKAKSIDGKNLEFKAKDFFARVIQHEIDHLDGILIIDK